jgi:hypothetical protein
VASWPSRLCKSHRIHQIGGPPNKKTWANGLPPLRYRARRTILLLIVRSHFDEVRIPLLENRHHIFEATLEIRIHKDAVKVSGLLTVEEREMYGSTGVWKVRNRYSPTSSDESVRHCRATYPYSSSLLAFPKRVLICSSVSVPRPRRRFSRSSAEGGEMKQ